MAATQQVRAVPVPGTPAPAPSYPEPVFLRPRRPEEPRSEAQLREHYLVERELAARLRNASKEERRELYSHVYDELLERVPHHPMLRTRRDVSAVANRQRKVTRSLEFVRRFLSSERVLMEIGAGDCAMSIRACGETRRVYAIEVSQQITSDVEPPVNLRLVLTDGCSIPLPDEVADVAFSDQLMEHLHPEDAEHQLREIRRCLARGGVYICVTPNRLYGPRDVSEYFDEVATGLHLREYCARDIRATFLEAGFRRVRFYAGGRRWFIRCPYALLALVERALELLPYKLRKRLADNAPARAFLGLRVAAFK
jgi:SAM-dependent methyltransferase